MLLAVDVGNTQTVFGLYAGAELGERFRIATEAQRTGDELGALLDDFVDFDSLDGICLSSTVPRLIREYEHVEIEEVREQRPELVARPLRLGRDAKALAELVARIEPENRLGVSHVDCKEHRKNLRQIRGPTGGANAKR